MKLSNIALILIVIVFALVIVMLDSCERKKRDEHKAIPSGTDVATSYVV